MTQIMKAWYTAAETLYLLTSKHFNRNDAGKKPKAAGILLTEIRAVVLGNPA